MIRVHVTIPLFGVKSDAMGADELNCVGKALSELLEVEIDDIEDVNLCDRPSQPKKHRREGIDISFSLTKEIDKAMLSQLNNSTTTPTLAQWTKAVNKLWTYKKYETDKGGKKFDPKPRELLKRLDFMVVEGDLLNSFQGRLLSWGAKDKLLSLGAVIVDRENWVGAEMSITNMRGYDLLSAKGKSLRSDPEIHMDVSFYPAGLLVVEIVKGVGMRKTDWLGKSDPYVMLELGGVAPVSRRGTTHKGGGEDCVFDEEFSLDVADAGSILLKVFDEDVGVDDLIGECRIDLLEVMRKGVVDTIYELSYEKTVGCLGVGKRGSKKLRLNAGQLHVVLTFFGGNIGGEGNDDFFYPVEINLEEGEVLFDEKGDNLKHKSYDMTERINCAHKREKEKGRKARRDSLAESMAVVKVEVEKEQEENNNKNASVVASSVGSKVQVVEEEMVLFQTAGEFGETKGYRAIPVDDDDGKLNLTYSNEERVKHPYSIDFIRMQDMLSEVQNEVESKKEEVS